MLLRKHLKKGYNETRLKDTGFHTEHKERNGEITHVGFVVSAVYGGPEPKPNNAGYRYDIIFETESEFQELLAWVERMKDRFPPGELPAIVGEEGADE